MDRWRVLALAGAAALLTVLPPGCDDDGSPEEGMAPETSAGDASSTGESPAEDDSTGGGADTTAPPSTSGDAPDEPPATTDDADTSGSSGSAGDDGTGGQDAAAVVSGFVTRSVEPSAEGDATGTLYLSLMQTCETGASAIEGMEIADADLSGNGTNVPFVFNDIAPGTYQLTGFLDDNGNFDGAGPDLGDLVAVEGVGPGCVEVTVGATDVQNVALDLNFVMPF